MWASSDTFTTGGGLVRVRSSSPETAGIVRALLADRLVADRPDLAADYSVRLEPPVAGAQPLHVLYEDCKVVRRSRDPVRIARSVVAHVTAKEELGRAGLLHVAGCAVVGTRGAVVLPLSMEPDVVEIERRLHRAGLALVDMPFLTFDTISGDLVVTPPPTIDSTAIDGVDLYRGREPGGAAPGHHRITGWLVDGRAGGEPREPVLQLVLNQETVPLDRAWQLVGRILERALVLSRWHPWPDDLVPAIVRLAEGRR